MSWVTGEGETGDAGSGLVFRDMLHRGVRFPLHFRYCAMPLLEDDVDEEEEEEHVMNDSDDDEGDEGEGEL